MRNKKGQNLFLAVITAVMIFAAGMMFLNHVPDDATLARNVGLDCTNPNISDGNKITCIAVDSTIPVVFLAIISLAGGAILSRFVV